MILIALISFLLISLYLLLIVRWHYAWKKHPSFTTPLQVAPVKLSVIIPVRNESENILAVLHSILAQSHPSQCIEIIIADDNSTDDTVSKAQSFFKEHSTINSIVIENDISHSSKKQVLKCAIEQSTGELIITTDADCLHHPDWLKTIAGYYSTHQPVMICGSVKMSGNNTFLQRFQEMDYLSLQASGAASLLLDDPLLCSGANLAFSRVAYNLVHGYDDNLSIPSGDDTFLMLKMHKAFTSRVHFIKSENSIVKTPCSASWWHFFQQRIRWISKTKNYSNSYISSVAVFISIINYWMLILLAFSLSNSWVSIYLICYLLVKALVDYMFLSSVGKYFYIHIPKGSFIMMELFYPFYLLILLAGTLRGSYEWKTRKHSI